jgi:hypothetical protein
MKPHYWHLQLLSRVFAAAMVFLAFPLAGFGIQHRGGQFIGLNGFGRFEKSPGAKRGETVLTSPEFVARINWDELVASWNADMPQGSYLKVEARALYPHRPTKYYTLGLWSPDPKVYPRESVPNQRDAEGDVKTDTLALKAPTDRFQVRVTLGGYRDQPPRLKFLGFSLTDGSTPETLPPNRFAWGKEVPVPERTQMSYPNGNVLCSPTTVSMILSYWANKLNRPVLDKDVPEIVANIYDTQWKGTGNWVFNTAYAGSLPRMRAYVVRFSDVSEIESWLANGIPVGLSVCYNKLRGRPGGTSGHLVVCVGFTSEGDVIVNDPGTRENVRKVFPRQNLIAAMAYSRAAAYLIYPMDADIPKDRFGHWDSWTARQQVRTEKPSISELK